MAGAFLAIRDTFPYPFLISVSHIRDYGLLTVSVICFIIATLIRYALPYIIMTMFISLYGIMDGLFISNFADKTSFAAISFILPFVCGMSSFGYMNGTGGAAVSLVIGQLIGSIVPVLYFARENNSLLRFVRPVFDGNAILKTCANGSSEMVVALCSSVVGFLYNLQLMRLAGDVFVLISY